MRALIVLFLLGAPLLALGCKNQGAGPGSRYPILVRSLTDVGDPLPGVRVVANKRDLGSTDAQGTLEAVIPGREGQRVDVQATCPDRYDGPTEQPVLLLKTFQSIDPQAKQRITLEVKCAARERIALVAIRSGRPNLPVKLRGAVVGRTSDTGTAHIVVRQPAGSSFQLTLDTAQQPDLKPQSPTRLFTVEPRDEFAVWDQTFEAAPKKVKRVHKAEPPPAAPPKPVPYRLD